MTSVAPAPKIVWRSATVIDVTEETPEARTLILDVPGWRVLSVAGSDAESDALVEQLTTDPAHGEPFGRRAIHTEDAERLREWRTGLARLDGDEVRHVDVRFALSDGWRWRELRASAFVRDDAGSVLEAIVLVRDVHERVEASLLLAERERAFREVFDVSPVGLAVVDDQGRFSAVNDAFCRLYGFDNLSLTDFDAYPISSIGYDKADYVRQMVRFLADPTAFTPGQPPVLIPTGFVPRKTS